ncbi:uncharacterized protein LOC119818468 isoform X3 [Arvicola amphibius]|uniref:uncharacterized protein LOC119818468 isoform X3 n=1 Tax=Arvicola amphibius TaxID=1047088 RepID=UPI0018E2ABA3|nr:uncharacterized protein LOC119818468 isoform X3 [Arvicola amphibius]
MTEARQHWSYIKCHKVILTNQITAHLSGALPSQADLVSPADDLSLSEDSYCQVPSGFLHLLRLHHQGRRPDSPRSYDVSCIRSCQCQPGKDQPTTCGAVCGIP